MRPLPKVADLISLEKIAPESVQPEAWILFQLMRALALEAKDRSVTFGIFRARAYHHIWKKYAKLKGTVTEEAFILSLVIKFPVLYGAMTGEMGILLANTN